MTTIRSLRSLAKQDAKRSLQLVINQDDIRKAKPLDPENCAAACAIKRQGFAQAIVMRSTTYVNHGTVEAPKWLRYHTPPSLAREIVALDRGGRVEPGDYLLSPHSNGRKLGYKPWKSRGGKTNKKPPIYRHVTAKIREA